MICSGRDKIETPEQVRAMRLHIYFMMNWFSSYVRVLFMNEEWF